MPNQLITMEEMAADFDRICLENGVTPQEFFGALRHAAATEYDADEDARVRKIYGLEAY